VPVPRNRGEHTTLLSSMTTGGMEPSLAIEGSTTAQLFETYYYVEKVLVPRACVRDRSRCDGLPLCPQAKADQGVDRAAGLRVALSVPVYSPDYDPIEEAFSKIKNLLLRKAAARSKKALVEAIGQALSAVTAEDALGYFERAGYRPTGQLP
jgi:hypothetical protein